MTDWHDTEISLHRSSAHTKTWVANVPSTEIHTAMESAGPLRACQAWVLRNAERFNVDIGDRTQWRRVSDDMFELWARGGSGD